MQESSRYCTHSQHAPHRPKDLLARMHLTVDVQRQGQTKQLFGKNSNQQHVTSGAKGDNPESDKKN